MPLLCALWRTHPEAKTANAGEDIDFFANANEKTAIPPLVGPLSYMHTPPDNLKMLEVLRFQESRCIKPQDWKFTLFSVFRILCCNFLFDIVNIFGCCAYVCMSPHNNLLQLLMCTRTASRSSLGSFPCVVTSPL